MRAVAHVEPYDDDPQWTLGDRLRKAREGAELTQGEMAERLHVSRATISAWETDAHKPVRDGWDLLRLTTRYSEETGVRVEWFRSRCLSPVPAVLGQMELAFPEPPSLTIAEAS